MGLALDAGVFLGAYSTQDISLDSAFGLLPLPLPFCSIRIQYSGPPGSVIGEVSSIEEKGDLVIDSRVRNEGDGWAGLGAHPWHLDKETESILFLTNMGGKDARIGFQVQAGGVHFYLTDLKLKPHETRAIDLRKLRDAQEVDFQGTKIPANASDGSVLWGRIDHGPVMGRLLVLQRHKGVASNYDCDTCNCEQSLTGLTVTPLSETLLPGQTQQVHALGWYTGCNGSSVPVDVTVTPTTLWSSLNPGIATVSAGGLVTARTGGTATITVQFSDWAYTPQYGSPNCWATWVILSAINTCNVLKTEVRTADVVLDRISVVLTPDGTSGQLVVTLVGTGGNVTLFNGTRSGGSHVFSFNRTSLPVRQYTQVKADWTVSGKTATGSNSVTFKVVGVYRHSRYNTPDEGTCTAGPGPAIKSGGPPACSYSNVNLKTDFISQSWLNGSGRTISFSFEQNEAICAYPPGFNNNFFRPVSSIVPACLTFVSDTTVARNPSNADLACGDQVLIVGLNGDTVKTVTDRCPDCSLTQLDNYTTLSACRPRAFGDFGNFTTIRLLR